MSIADMGQKIKSAFEGESAKDIYVILIILFTALGSFGLGRWSVSYNDEENPVLMLQNGSSGVKEAITETSEIARDIGLEAQSASANSAKLIVASSKGTKYYYSWCSGAKSLTEANKVYFNSESEAQAAGYSKSTSCK